MTSTDSIFELPEAFYDQLAALVAGRIAGLSYFNGRIEIDWQELHCQLVTTLLIYRDGGEIVDIVPVWCELLAQDAERERLCDFDWELLCKKLL